MAGDPHRPTSCVHVIEILRADAEKTARILAAEAEVQAILKVKLVVDDSFKLLNEANPSCPVIRLKALKAFRSAVNGKATIIIIPSEIQGLAGMAESLVVTVQKFDARTLDE